MLPAFLLGAVLAAGSPSAGAAGPTTVVGPSQPATITPTTVKQYVVTRLQRTDVELADRARDVIAFFTPETPNAQLLENWARTSLAQDPKRWLKVHPLPDDAPGLVVMYQPLNDDLLVMDLVDLHRPPWPPKLELEPVAEQVGVGEVAARTVMVDTARDLEDRGVIATGFSTAAAELGVYREKVKNGAEASAWIMEYQWTMNRIVDGVEIIDAGVRIGIHHEGTVSSIRVTDVAVSPVSGSDQPVLHDAASARQRLVDDVHAKYQDASIHIEQERVAVVLDPDRNSATLTPGMLFNYSLRFEDAASGNAAVSRQQLATVPLPGGGVHGVFPIPGSL